MLQNLPIVISIIILTYLPFLWFLIITMRMSYFAYYVALITCSPFFIIFYCFLLGSYFERWRWELFSEKWWWAVALGLLAALWLGMFIQSKISFYIMVAKTRKAVIGKDMLKREPKIKERIKKLKEKWKKEGRRAKISPERQQTLNEELRKAMDRGCNAKYALDLIEKGADFTKADEFKITPLMKQHFGDGARKAAVLLELGAKVETRDDVGITPLMYAAREGDLRLFQTILGAGADPHARDNEGKNALVHFIEWGNSISTNQDFLIETLLMVCDINAQDKKGKTPLMYAVERNDYSLVKTLIKKGARLDLKNKNGRTAVEHAYDKHHDDLVKLLKKAAAK